MNTRLLTNEEAQLMINQKQELDFLLSFNGLSKSQLRQDIFVLSELGFIRDGYFVEFGATDGVKFSNTHLLEYLFDWKGILVEPLASKYNDLIINRRCHIENMLVWTDSGKKIDFLETPVSDLSTIYDFHDKDLHSNARQGGNLTTVDSISLLDLLDKYSAPRLIDYLSIDTEGSEYEILKAFDFDKYKFRVITCEHNYTDMRDSIYTLLTSKGYIRKYHNLSQFDDWYILDLNSFS